MKWPAALGLALAFSGCMTLENRRDLYTADYDRWPVNRWTTRPAQTTTTTTVTKTETKPIKTRKTAPELKPIPNEAEDPQNLPAPLPPPQSL